MLQKIFIRPKEQVSCMKELDISEQNLYDKFTDNHGQTIYVTDCGKVKGMITVGNFSRNCLDGGELITRQFIKVDLKHEKDAVRILDENTWMESLPIINDRNEIEKEYYKRYYSFGEDRIKAIFKIIQQIIFEMRYFGGFGPANKMIIYSDLLDNKLIENLRKQADSNIMILNRISIEKIKNFVEGGYRFVCDFAPESYRVREIYYKKYGIHGIKWELEYNEIRECLADRVSYFKKKGIAVFAGNENRLFKWIGNVDVQQLYLEQFVWNSQVGCLEYRGELDDDVECIFTMICFSKVPYIVRKKEDRFQYVPILSRLYWDRQEGIMASEFDLATNILPVLQKHNIKFLLLRDPDTESEISSQLQKRYMNGRQAYKYEKIFFRDWEEDAQCRIRELKSISTNMKYGVLQRADMNGKYVNFINGERLTVGNAKTGPSVLHFFGPCILIGTTVEDKYTIPSQMRQMISKQYYIKNHTPDYENINYAIRAEKFNGNDIITFVVSNVDLFEKTGFKTCSILQGYHNIPDLLNNVKDQLKHCNQVATKYIAKKIYHALLHGHFFENENVITNENVYFGTGKRNIPKELKEWLTNVSIKYKVQNVERAGAAVMNCNPFTRGHRYLIETASKQVDVLYVFVLEEDKSYFNFQNRFEMVKEGTTDLTNVIVLPGGQYVISTQTMPGYFNKEEQPFIESDAVMDLTFFAEAIAKEFEIKVRFAGEEPKDKFTRKYNEAMGRILPEYGIDFFEIPRKQIGENVISASQVRKCIEEHKYEAIKELVLPCTYNYLKQRFFN